MAAIRIKNLAYTWPGASEPTLQIPELTVARGESVFLRGASGSGKSTLLSLLSGILPAPAETVAILDEDLSSMSVRKRDRFRAQHIGIVFQQFNLIPFLSVAANLRLAARFAHQADAETEQRTQKLIGALQLHPDLLERKAEQLSVGQQQRVAVARAIVNSPNLILADEPTGNLDSEHGEEVMKILSALNDEGTTIVMVTHSAEDAAVGKRIVRMLDGKIISETERTEEVAFA